ncbi:MAG: hypothetical protein AAF135_06545 [Bacteroidota bacterium]
MKTITQCFLVLGLCLLFACNVQKENPAESLKATSTTDQEVKLPEPWNKVIANEEGELRTYNWAQHWRGFDVTSNFSLTVQQLTDMMQSEVGVRFYYGIEPAALEAMEDRDNRKLDIVLFATQLDRYLNIDENKTVFMIRENGEVNQVSSLRAMKASSNWRRYNEVRMKNSTLDCANPNCGGQSIYSPAPCASRGQTNVKFTVPLAQAYSTVSVQEFLEGYAPESPIQLAMGIIAEGNVYDLMIVRADQPNKAGEGKFLNQGQLCPPRCGSNSNSLGYVLP